MAREAYIAGEALAVAGAAVGFTAATFLAATVAFVQCQDAAIRYRLDGTNPTATVGLRLDPGDVLVLDFPDQISRIRFIRESGTSAVAFAQFAVN